MDRSSFADSQLAWWAGVAGGLAAVAAGLCWAIKALAILATGRQPALLFELAPLLMAIALLGLGRQLPSTEARAVSTGAAMLALLAAMGVLANQLMPLSDLAYAVAMGGANLLILVSLIAAGLGVRRRLRALLPLVLGVTTLPALLAGGLAAAVLGDRALELPLVILGFAWLALGVRLARGQYSCTGNADV